MSIEHPRIIDYEGGISAIDAEYVASGVAASHLVVDGGEAALVDVGTNHSVPVILAALKQKGIAPEQVRYVCVTHIHLDHAGGAGRIMRELPQATLVTHPRAERHMVDPSKLYQGALAVYGEEAMARLYGELEAVPQTRVQSVNDGDTLALGDREWVFLDTPGHAYHHYSIHDPQHARVFSGDTFGLSYRALDTDKGVFIFPSTTPVHFDPEAAHQSIERLMALQPEAIHLAHFGEVRELARLAEDLHRGLDAMVAIARRHADAGEARYDRIVSDIRNWLLDALRAHGCELASERIDAIIGMDVDINAQGLEVWLDKQQG